MTPRSLRSWLLAGLATTTAVFAQTPITPQSPAQPVVTPSTPPPAPTPATPITSPTIAAVDDEMIDGIKLTDATIDHVLMLIEDWTGRTVLRPQQLPTPTFAINLKHRIPKSEAILALETLLNLNGIGIVPVGDKFLKVVDLPRMRMEAPPMIEGSTLDLPPSGQIASKLFQLEFQRVTEFLPQINMMLNGNIGGYVVFEKSNAALITDSISTLQRVELLLKKLDQPLVSGLNPKFYSVRNVKASEIVNKINAIIQGPLQSQLGSTTRFTADDRTNQIVLLCDPRQYPFFDDLISKLDIQSDPNTRNEVIYLKHATAKDVATLLTNLIQGQSKATAAANAPRPGQIILPTAPGTPPAGQPAQPNIDTSRLLGDLGTNTQEFSGLVDIQPDERSNAVVVSGTIDDIRLIKELVDKIDILLAQVRIEVVIAEVTLSDSTSNGISSLGITVDGSRVTGISGGIAGLSGSGGDGSPITATLKRANGATTLSLAALLTPITNKSNVEFLSSPTIVTTHNKEAHINITEQLPVITSIQRAATAVATTPTTPVDNGFNTSSSVTYKDIGIQLKVKPLIGKDDNIQLEIDQIVDDQISTVTVDGNPQPVIGHREASSFINVSSDEMIVLGGLQRHHRELTKGRWGILYEVPILGRLLGPHSKKSDRTELLVFIRPHVIKPDENVADTNKLIDQQAEKEVIRNFINPNTRANPDKGPKQGAPLPATEHAH